MRTPWGSARRGPEVGAGRYGGADATSMREFVIHNALYWIEPEARGIIPLDRFHVPSRLARTASTSTRALVGLAGL